jgi:osmotically-inducible protein OsmY
MDADRSGGFQPSLKGSAPDQNARKEEEMPSTTRRTAPVPVLVVCLVVVALTATAPTAQERNVTDEEITGAVELGLVTDEAVSSHMIDVTTHDGVVELSGTVSTILSRDRAAAIAESVKGVRAVVNDLTVVPVERTDAQIKGDITMALATDPVAHSWKINVAVSRGKVILTGTVDTWAERRFADRLVRGVKGVKEVENDLSISYETARNDAEIKTEVERTLEWDPYLDEHPIDVAVDNGDVILTGTVGSAAEKTRAKSDAYLGGAETVDAGGLEVEPWARNTMERQTKTFIKPDSEIKQAVMDALTYDPRVFSLNVDVGVDHGQVTLTGVVDALRAKNAAAEDARNTAGVWLVVNNIKVRPTATLTDSEIQSRVEAALLRDAVVERHDLSATVRNHKVYLYGTVDSYYEKVRAEDVAASVQGVADVEDNLVVDYQWIWKSDDDIAKDIENEYFWSVLIDPDDITVSVKDGVATLSGVVRDWQEYKAAVENAFDAGAREVKSNLQIEGVPGYAYRVYESKEDLLYAYHTDDLDTFWFD